MMSELINSHVQELEASLVRELLSYSQKEGVLSLAGGLPDERCMPDLPACSTDSSLQYGASEGESVLLEHVELELEKIGFTNLSKQVLITNGSQQGLDISARLVLNSDAIILTEQPTYLSALQIFSLQGASVKGIQSDDDGMVIDDLREAIKHYRPKAVYLIPTFQNPTGHCYSRARREEIAHLLDETGTLLIEDNPYHELYYEDVDRTPIASLLKKAPWIYMGSYSKVLWPGLRIGYLAASMPLLPHLVKLKQATDLHTNRLGQHLVANYVSSDAFSKHLLHLQEAYRSKRDYFVTLLESYLGDSILFQKPAGGMFVWVTLPSGISAEWVMREALKENVLVLPSSPFYVRDVFHNGGESEFKEKDHYLRLNFTRLTNEEMKCSVAVLNKVIRKGLS